MLPANLLKFLHNTSERMLLSFTQELKTNGKKDAIISVTALFILSSLECQAPNETIFYTHLREYLQTDEGQFYQNSIVFDNSTGKIKVILVSVRFFIFKGLR